jgi:NAD(P)-dependent dehydrogenase (short-subunit alcohol dehydrogenase family)
MTVALITGANKGLGRETARRLLEVGFDVYLSARNEVRGREAASELGCRFVQLDVTSDVSVRAAADLIDHQVGLLDVLINNAGVPDPAVGPLESGAAELLEVYETNVFGVVRVTSTLLPLLERSTAPVIVNVSSGLGSLSYASDPNRVQSSNLTFGYPSSKSALNMLTLKYARALPRFRVNAVAPGFTATDFNNNSGTKTVEQGAEIIVQMAGVASDGPTGTFVSDEGPLPW